MTKLRHQNQHLRSEETALLKAWAWEEAHRDKDGPAHRLFRAHGMHLGQPLSLVHAADLEFRNEEAFGDRIVPMAWPWGEQTIGEICENLRARTAEARFPQDTCGKQHV